MTQRQCFICYYGLFKEAWHVVDALQSNQLDIFEPLLGNWLGQFVAATEAILHIFNTCTFPTLTNHSVLQSSLTSLSSSDVFEVDQPFTIEHFYKKFVLIFSPHISSICITQLCMCVCTEHRLTFAFFPILPYIEMESHKSLHPEVT